MDRPARDKDTGTDRILQIDLLKAIAILMVVFGHTFYFTQAPAAGAIGTGDTSAAQPALTLTAVLTRWMTYSGLLTQQAVPVFILLMGLNFGMSYSRRAYSRLSDIYTRHEFYRRARRFLVPFGGAFVASLAIGAAILAITGRNVLTFNLYTLVGNLPIDGPGNYFNSLIFQFIVVFPVMYVVYARHPRLLVAASFAIALLFELLVTSFDIISGARGVYLLAIVRFLPLIALGLWISNDTRLFARRNWWLIGAGVASGAYIVLVNQFSGSFHYLGLTFVEMFKSQNLLAACYTALLVLVGIYILPRKRGIVTGLAARIGAASYHIFLVQIIYFGVNVYLNTRYRSLADIVSPYNLAIVAINLIVCVGLGLLFYETQRRLTRPDRPQPARTGESGVRQ